MKKRLLCILAALIIQMISIPAVYAETTTPVASFEPGSLVVTVKKEFGTLAYPTDVTVKAYDQNGKLNYINIIPVGTDGKLEFKYYNTGISGNYTFKFVIGALGIEETATMTNFIGQDYWNIYCEAVNEYVTSNDVNNFKDKILNEEKLNLNLDGYNNLDTDEDRNKVFNVMIADHNVETGYQLAEEVRHSFADAVSFVKYSKTKNSKEYYNTVGKRLGIPSGTKEDSISILDEVSTKAQDAVFAAVNSKISNCTGKKETAALFLQHSLYTVIENANHYTDVQYVMNAYINAGLLEEEKDMPIEVYKALMNRTFSTETAFKSAVKKAKESIGDEPSSNKPSGGGGGGGGGGFVAPTQDTKPQVTEPQVTVPSQATEDVHSAKMTFSDMEDVKWAVVAVDNLFERGIIAGVGNGKFDPHSYVTREQFAKMLCSLGGFEPAATNLSFTDVSKSSWSYPYICTAYNNGIVSGISNTQFAPTEKVTREQAVAMLYRMISKDFEEYTGEFKFEDDASISDWAKFAVYDLYDRGVVNGRTSKTFSPNEAMTRVEAAALLYSAVTKVIW